MNRPRKNRSSSARGGRGKTVERQVSADGIYSNHRFIQAVGALVGLPVQIQTKTNDLIEGVFTTFSPSFDLVLDMAHPISRSDPNSINPETVKRKMIFTAPDIVTIKVANVDLEYATREGFQVDTVISRYNGQVSEKPLEPWQGDITTEDSLTLGDESSVSGKNGWDVDDMFRKNEEKYGVTTSYTPEMVGYTTPLNRRNTREYREREARATIIAEEILNSPGARMRAEIENGDEEEKFSAVYRPDQASGGGGGGGGGKYVPPMLRKKNQNSGKLMRSTPPPQGTRHNHGSSNPTTPTSPSYPGPPQAGSGSHSPISGPGGASPGYPQQQQVSPATHSPSPAGHPAMQRHNSQSNHHAHNQESKVNGDSKGSYDRRSHESVMNENSREGHHSNDHSSKQEHHGRQHHSGPHGDGSHPNQPQQKPSKPPQQQHSHQLNQHVGHMPPVGQGDHRKAEPREQREPRKQRTNKEEQIADLKKFSQDFKLTEQPDKKGQPQQQQPQQQPSQQPPQQQQQPPPQQQQQQQQQPPPQQQAPPQQPPPPQQQQPPPQQSQPPPPQQQSQPPQQQQQPSPSQQQQHQQQQQQQQQHQPQLQPQPQHTHLPPQPHAAQRQTSPVTTPAAPAGPPQSVPQNAHHPQNPPPMTISPGTDLSKSHEDVEKITTAVTNSKLNPNAKEFVFNPNAKPFSPRSPSTTTPPRPHTPQTPQIPTNQLQQMPGGPPVGYQPTVMSAAAYVMAPQPFAVQPQPPRFPKRVPGGNNQRPEYTSQMQVAAATGQPILAPAPMNTQPQAITAVQIPQNMLPQTPAHYQQYPGMQMIPVRFPPTGAMQMVTAVVPTSMGMYPQSAESQQQSQQHGHQTMFMTSTSLPPHQPHPAHTPGPGPQPTQPPTPQNPGGGGGPPNMPTQPPTPGPTPPQPLIYPHMAGQPPLPQHLSQHSPHTAPSPHTPQYPGQNAAAAAAAAAAGHHGGPGQQMAAQIVMLPPNMQAGPHMIHPSGPPPHSATAHIPSSMAGFTPTSSAAVQHMPSAPHIQYMQGKHPRFPH